MPINHMIINIAAILGLAWALLNGSIVDQFASKSSLFVRDEIFDEYTAFCTLDSISSLAFLSEVSIECQIFSTADGNYQTPSVDTIKDHLRFRSSEKLKVETFKSDLGDFKVVIKSITHMTQTEVDEFMKTSFINLGGTKKEKEHLISLWNIYTDEATD
ncbi:MAG: hypothetical protein EOP04_07485 [Proteobacteria bacterium]|nr:MAG: hypothetical protein EOP04_07485 [Pseudomonadota bacterium]